VLELAHGGEHPTRVPDRGRQDARGGERGERLAQEHLCFNTVERLNKHPSVFINYLRVLANAKGMTFNIQHPPAPTPTEEENATDDQAAAAPQKKKTKVESRASSIVSAKDLSEEEYDEISQRKRIGKTTTDENLQCDKHYWQNFFLTNELNELVLKNFLYGINPLQNYVELIDTRNHENEDNLKSEKQLSKIEIVKALLERLGWESARDEDAIGKEDLRRYFVNNVVGDPLFKRQKRLNELFNLNKSYNIHKEMTPQQVLMWCNSLLKDFSLQIRADKETYYLELQNDLLTLIKRKNNIGKIYYDRDNLLKQVALNQQEDLFIDDEPPQPQEVVPAEPEQETPTPQQQQETPTPPQEEEETPPPPPPAPAAPSPARVQPEPETPPPKSTTLAQEFAEWKRDTGNYDMSLREYKEFVEWKQKMELYDTSLLDL